LTSILTKNAAVQKRQLAQLLSQEKSTKLIYRRNLNPGATHKSSL